MDRGAVEECPLRQREIRDRVAVVEAFHVRPVLLSIDLAVLGCTKCHVTVECLREELVEVLLVTGNSGTIGEGDSDWRHARSRTRRLNEGGTEIEEARPFSRVLGGCSFPVRGIDE